MPAGLRLVLRLVLAVAAAVLAVSPARSGAAAAPPATPAVITAGGTAVGAVSGAVGYGAPLTGPVVVVRGFQPPANRYGPGHRGVDLASVEGRWVLAAGAGQVSFAGQVAGRGVVVIRHPDGVQHEIYRQMEFRNMPLAQPSGVAAPVPTPAASVPEQIEQLAHLRDQGHITAAEYEQKKAQLLERM